VFRRLKEANLKLNPEKCQFFKKELLYLGHRVTSEGIGTDPGSDLPEFSKIVKPLNDLLRKGSKWEWAPEQQMAFEEVKARLVSDPVLQ